MDEQPATGPDPASPDPATPDAPLRPGRLTREAAVSLLARGDDLLASGDFADAAVHYQRVVGFDDLAVTAAALLGLGEARYRLDDEDGAVATWKAVVDLGNTPSTYKAWRNLAAARVRAGELDAAKRAYREADRLAPAADKAEIANRLGWLAKETGDTGAARRYFAKGRSDGPAVPLTWVIIAATVIVSLTTMFTAEGDELLQALWLDKDAVANGEIWRLWTVTLVHGGLLHLFFNMYALFLAGPIVERWYGSITFLLFYLACAAAGSVASFVMGGDVPAVGASGAIFGLFGVLVAASRVHHPVDRANRTIVSQLGMLILLNLVIGFASGGSIDNAAHIGGLLAGLWLGAIARPTGVPTLSSGWQWPGASRASAPAADGAGAATTPDPSRATGRRAALAGPAVGLIVVAALVVAGLLFGSDAREALVVVPALAAARRWSWVPAWQDAVQRVVRRR